MAWDWHSHTRSVALVTFCLSVVRSTLTKGVMIVADSSLIRRICVRARTFDTRSSVARVSEFTASEGKVRLPARSVKYGPLTFACSPDVSHIDCLPECGHLVPKRYDQTLVCQSQRLNRTHSDLGYRNHDCRILIGSVEDDETFAKCFPIKREGTDDEKLERMQGAIEMIWYGEQRGRGLASGRSLICHISGLNGIL